MSKREKTKAASEDPAKTYGFSGRSLLCRECAFQQCTHRCKCHPPVRTDRCPLCGGEFWALWEVIDWEGTEEEYERARKSVAVFGMDYIAPGKFRVERPILTTSTGPGLLYGRGYLVAPAGQPVTHTRDEVEKALWAFLEESVA